MFSLLTTLVATPAHAYLGWGNPTLTVAIVRDENDFATGAAYLDGIRVHHCNGSYDDYVANTSIDPTVGYSTTITGGDLCYVELLWDAPTVVTNNSFTLKANVTSSIVPIEGEVSTKDWNPFFVISGSFSGTEPEIEITLK